MKNILDVRYIVNLLMCIAIIICCFNGVEGMFIAFCLSIFEYLILLISLV